MNVREWWAQRTLREQRLLLLALVSLVIGGWIVGVIRPGTAHLHALEAAVAGQRAQLKRMERAADELATLRADPAMPAIAAGESPLLTVQQLGRDMELEAFMEQAQSQGQEGVQVRFKALPYESLLRWLAQASQRGLRVRALTLAPAATG